MSILPGNFLFRYKFTVLYNGRIPGKRTNLLKLSSKFALPDISELNNQTPFCEIRLAWNTTGLGICISVTGKSIPPVVNSKEPQNSDLIHLWFDTRDTQSIHRASRYCHHFTLFPLIGNYRDQSAESVLQHQIPNAREDAPASKISSILNSTTLQKNGYQLSAWFPASTLHGFDPEMSPRIGFYYHLQDMELGDQYLTVNRDFPISQDPSLWSTLELKRESE